MSGRPHGNWKPVAAASFSFAVRSASYPASSSSKSAATSGSQLPDCPLAELANAAVNATARTNIERLNISDSIWQIVIRSLTVLNLDEWSMSSRWDLPSARRPFFAYATLVLEAWKSRQRHASEVRCGGSRWSSRWAATVSASGGALQPVGEFPVSPGGVFQAGTSSESLDNSLGSWLRTSSSSRLEIRSPDSR